MSTLRRLLPAALAVLTLAPAAAAAADAPLQEPSKWSCGPTVPGSGDDITIGGRPAAYSNGVITLPSPAYPSGIAYPIVARHDDYFRTIGTYRDGCVSVWSGAQVGVYIHPPDSRPNWRGTTAGGEPLDFVVQGKFDEATAKVWFGDTPVPAVFTRTASCDGTAYPCPSYTVEVTTPPHPAGWVDVSVRDDQGTVLWGQSAAINDFQYVAPPTIRAVTPSHGPLAGGNEVQFVVDGDITYVNSVTIGGKPAAFTGGYQLQNSGIDEGLYDSVRVTATVPPGTTAGAADIVAQGTSVGDQWPRIIRDYAIAGATPSADDYTYDGLIPSPTITSQRGRAFADLGGVLLLRGTSLDGIKSVRVAGKFAKILSRSPTQVYVGTPALPAGTWSVKAITTAGTTLTLAKLTYRKVF